MTNLTIQFFVLLRHLNRQSPRVNIKWLTLCKKGFIIVACCFFLPSLSKVSVTLRNNWLTCPISVYFIPSWTNSINIIMSSSSSPSLLSLLYHYYHHCHYFYHNYMTSNIKIIIVPILIIGFLKPGAHESYLLSQISFVVDCVRR